MGMLVILLPAEAGDLPLGREVARGLARLGVTALSVFGDRETVGVVLEGWAFDARVSAGRAVEVVAPAATGVRALQPVLEMAVSAATDTRE